MNINNILRHHLLRTDRVPANVDVLQPKQVIQGTIVKIFPNNQALIKIGQEHKVAQLDTALAVGERYYFQVLNNEPFIHLRVLGEPLAQEMTANIQALLRQLGLSTHRQLEDFAQHLIREKIPFDRNTLTQSLPLLALGDDKQTTFQVIQHMLTNQLPLTKNVFQAQQMLVSERLTNLLQLMDDPAVQSFLRETPRGQELLLSLKDYKQPMQEHQFSRQLLHAIQENQPLNELLQALHMTRPEIQTSDRSFPTLLNEREAIFNVELTVLRDMMQRLVSSQEKITTLINEFLKVWETELNSAIHEQRPISTHNVTLMNEQLQAIFQLFIPNDHREAVKQPFQQFDQLSLMLNALSALQEESTYQAMQQILTTDFSPKAELLQQINHTLTLLGINYEQLIAAGQVNEQQLTLKQTLLQMIQQQLPVDQERVQQLLHFINGLQIQSVEETNHFIYGNLVLPGEKLQLNSDLYMQFQSKKTATNTIDPNHCRILFFLDLEALDHTIVDMNVQDRIISITVFNNKQLLKSLVQPFENSLKRQLNDMNYQLSVISYKPLAENKVHLPTKQPQQFSRKNYSGVDFRI